MSMNPAPENSPEVDCMVKQLRYLVDTGFFRDGVTIVAGIDREHTAVISSNPLILGKHMEVMAAEYSKFQQWMKEKRHEG